MTDFKDGTEALTDDGALPHETTEESAPPAPLAEAIESQTTEGGQYAPEATQTERTERRSADDFSDSDAEGNDFVQFSAPAHTVKDNGWAIAAFVLAFLVAPAGLILGIIGVVYSRKIDDAGKGLSIAAIVIGAVIIVVYALICVLLVVMFRDMAIAIINGLQQNINDSNAAAIVSLLR